MKYIDTWNGINKPFVILHESEYILTCQWTTDQDTSTLFQTKERFNKFAKLLAD